MVMKVFGGGGAYYIYKLMVIIWCNMTMNNTLLTHTVKFAKLYLAVWSWLWNMKIVVQNIQDSSTHIRMSHRYLINVGERVQPKIRPGLPMAIDIAYWSCQYWCSVSVEYVIGMSIYCCPVILACNMSCFSRFDCSGVNASCQLAALC